MYFAIFSFNLHYTSSSIYVTNDDKETSYSVEFPDYLRFNGNLALIDKNDNALIVWISLFKDKTYMYEMLLDANAQLLNESDLQDENKVYSDKRKP